MSRNNLSTVLAAAILATLQMPAIGQSGPITVQELTNRQADLKRIELDTKLSEARAKITGGNAQTQFARTCDDDLSLYAVYGVGKKLRADFGFHGAVVTLAPGAKIDAGGWYVEELTPTRAMMIKKTNNKIVAHCPIYLSNGVKPAVPLATVVAGSTAASNVMVPPIIPVSASRAR